MNPHTTDAPLWTTASSHGDWSEACMRIDLSALEAHLQLCKPLSGRLFRLQCGADAVRGFMASRLMTSLLIMGLLLSVSLLTLL